MEPLVFTIVYGIRTAKNNRSEEFFQLYNLNSSKDFILSPFSSALHGSAFSVPVFSFQLPADTWVENTLRICTWLN